MTNESDINEYPFIIIHVYKSAKNRIYRLGNNYYRKSNFLLRELFRIIRFIKQTGGNLEQVNYQFLTVIR